MLYRFPPHLPGPNDRTFLTGPNEHYAKLKIEASAGKRTVLMTESTLIFVIRGVKLLHFSGETIEVTPKNVFLLKKGIYVMAEYIEDDLGFEALMLFLPQRVLMQFMVGMQVSQAVESTSRDYFVMPESIPLRHFKEQLRHYFDHRIFDYSKLMPLKQQEALVLLVATTYRNQIHGFIRSAARNDMEELHFIMQTYLFQPITIYEMAGLCNRSLARFKRDFQKYYQTSPRAWINQQRLKHARLLLNNTDKSVAQISSECGFDNISYFIRLFKSAYHCTPSAFRTKNVIL